MQPEEDTLKKNKTQSAYINKFLKFICSELPHSLNAKHSNNLIFFLSLSKRFKHSVQKLWKMKCPPD